MKSIKQIRELQVQLSENVESSGDVRKLTTLVRAGLFDPNKLTMLKRALNKDNVKMTRAERDALLELLDRLLTVVMANQGTFMKVKQSIQEEISPEQDGEFSMARSDLKTAISSAQRILDKLNGEGKLEAWLQSKITLASDYLSSAANYVDSGEAELKEEYEEYKSSGRKFYVTEKLDGTSATFYYKDGVFGVCSRNLELLETEGNTFWKVARELDLENKMRDFGVNISLQGELIGEGIQGNPYKIKGQTVKFFNLFDIDLHVYQSLAHLGRALGIMGLKMVPIVDEFFNLPETMEELLKYAEDKSILNSNFDREGVVIRSNDRTISFKVISNKFLLKSEN